MEAIDWDLVNWLSVIILTVLVFISALVGSFINIIFDGNPVTGAIVIAFLFAVAFIGWTYYPHGIDVGQATLPVGREHRSVAPGLVSSASPVVAGVTLPQLCCSMSMEWV